MDERSLGKQLQAARQAAGLTQQQLCQKANLSFSTLTKIERGAIRAPSIFTIQAIAGALDSSLDDLIGFPALPARQLLKTKSGVSFIYFDVNGSLVHFFQRAFTRLAHETNTPIDIIESDFWRYNDEVCRGTMSLDDFNKTINQNLNISGFDWKQYYVEAVEPVTELHELLIWAAQNYHIGLLTNIMPGFIAALTKSGKLPNVHYDAIIDSSEVGIIKPERAIYEIATTRAAVPSSEILLIDDTRANLTAAQALGWRVLWFDDSRVDESVERARQALEPAVEPTPQPQQPYQPTTSY